MNNFIPVNSPLIKEREKELVMQCLDSGWISSEGPFVSEFEDKFSKKVNRKFGIACSSGTAALDIAMAALNIGPGDEVIIPAFTIISCASAVYKTGAKIVLVDCDQYSWNVNPEEVCNAINEKTKAILLVHIYGLPVDIDPIIKVAKSKKIAIIEDAAEQIGGEYKGKPCGSFGDISTFSFYPNKHITTGEGGMIVTNEFDLSEKCKSLRNLCFKAGDRFVHDELGWNYRMTNLQAALGLAQLERLEESIEKKREIGNYYHQELKDFSLIQLPLKKLDYARNIFWVFAIVLSPKLGNAKNFMEKMRLKNIGTRPFFYPIHKQPVFKKFGYFKNDMHPNSEFIYKQGLYLPSGLNLKFEEIDIVVKVIKELCNLDKKNYV